MSQVAEEEADAITSTLPILALAVGCFAIGTTEFVTMGLLPRIAETFAVSQPVAGYSISSYAVGVVAGAPLLGIAAARYSRRAMLILLMLTYALCNLATAAAPAFAIVVASRLLGGMPHGVYAGIASLVAAGIVGKQRQARAVAAVILGMSAGAVAGVPLATRLGQLLGWRYAYLSAALVAFLAVGLIARAVPDVPAPVSSPRQELRTFVVLPQAWLTLAVGAVGFGGMFAVYSYIAGTVTNVGGLPESGVPVFLLVFGIGMVVGTWTGGRLASYSLPWTLIAATTGNVAALLAFYVLAPHGFPALIGAFLITACGSVLVVALQLRLMNVAAGAETLGASMNHASLNLGNALGALAGGWALQTGFGYRGTAVAGALLAAAGVVLILVSLGLERLRPSVS